MDNESRERLVRVEEGMKYMTGLIENHITTPCPQFGCTIKQDIVSLRVTQKWTIWMGRTAVGAMIVGFFSYIVPKISGIIGGIDGF